MIFALVLVLAGCAGGAAPTEAGPNGVEARVQRPNPIPPTAVSGPELEARLVEASGRVRVFNFWATWCPPCLAEMPMLRTYAFRHPEIEIVLVNVDHVSAQGMKVPIAIRNLGLESLGHLLLASEDPNRTLRAHVKDWPQQLPTTLIVSPTGVRTQMVAEALTVDRLDAAIRAANASDAQPQPGPG